MSIRLHTVITPVAFFLCGLIGTGILYQTIEANEKRRLQSEAEITAEQVRLRLEAWIDTRTGLFEHLSQHQFVDETDIAQNFRHHALTIVDLYPDIQAVNFIDRQWVIRKVVPAQSNAPALNKDLHNHPSPGVVAALQRAETTGEFTRSPIMELLQSGKGFATYHPLMDLRGQKHGFVNGVFRVQELVDACLYEKVLRERFWFRLVAHDGGVAYSHLPADQDIKSDSRIVLPVRIVDRSWNLELLPSAEYQAASSTAADEIMAGLGLVLAAVLALLLRILLTRQDALRESQAKYRLLVENQIDLVVKLDPAGNFLYVSPSYCEAFDLTEEELLGTNFKHLVHPEDRKKAQASLAELAQPPHRSYNEQRSITSAEVIWQAWTNAAVLDKDGNLEAITAVGRDITRRRELEDQLALSRKMQAVGQLAGGIAHDFNNLLQAMLGNLQFVEQDTQPTGQTAADIKEIEKGIDRAMILTRQLLAFSRKQAFEPKQEDLNTVVESTLHRFRSTLRSAIILNFEATGNKTPVRIDGGQIEQIVQNLVDNARDAITSAGTIKVGTEVRTLDEDFCDKYLDLQAGQYVVLTVGDDGHGMPPEVLERAFEPFYTTREVGAGTGLGLATIYGIVQQHYGTILATSTVQQGSRFSVYLPHDSQDENGTPEAQAQPSTGNFETILMAEDDRSVRNLAVRVLQKANYKVLVAEDGQQAIDLFTANQGQVDLVILDLVMPNVDGREARNAIVALQPDIPVLFASGYDPATLAGEGLPTDQQNILMKPYGITDLLHKVRQILDQGELPEQPVS